jgi:hypothetical protein
VVIWLPHLPVWLMTWKLGDLKWKCLSALEWDLYPCKYSIHCWKRRLLPAASAWHL